MAEKKAAPVKKSKSRKLWKLYDVSSGKLVRKNRFSPKSQGDFLAEHKDRRTCGKSSYMEKK